VLRRGTDGHFRRVFTAQHVRAAAPGLLGQPDRLLSGVHHGTAMWWLLPHPVPLLRTPLQGEDCAQGEEDWTILRTSVSGLH